MLRNIRIKEYVVLLLRILLVYIFYFIARFLFFIYNKDLLKVDDLETFLYLSYKGLIFDTTAILYINLLFIVMSILPFWINTSLRYQKVVFYVYFIFNLLAYVTNFIDLIYYKYIFSRTTLAVFDVLKNENNLPFMFLRFLYTYWHVTLLFILLSFLWIYLYKKIKLFPEVISNKLLYFSSSLFAFFIIALLIVGGIRGDFKKSTRPINMIDANRYAKLPQHADVILNTPFAIIRTFGKSSFKKQNLVSQEAIEKYIKPTKQYNINPPSKPNIVLFIVESYGREYLASFNEDTTISNYKGYTPFIDSLAQHSLIFTNAYANGSKSIHGMSSVLAGVPSFKDAFTSSPFPKQKIQSLVSVLNNLGYDTSFYHGAPNGSMGFMGFSNILGIKNYYGLTEYNNNEDFDGYWGIWDEPFFKYVKNSLDNKKQPFFSTIFTISSHEPYIVPKKYKNKFPKGDIKIHPCVAYTDYSFKKFFDSAKNEKWFANTLFIITADHGNLKFYDEYMKVLNRDAVPILFYMPNSNLKGKNKDLAQQIDIYPTILDIIGYNKPFRSWGRSLINDNDVKPFVISYNANQYHLQRGNYICSFDGSKITGIYNINDKGLEKNLISNELNQEMKENIEVCKAFIQEYFNKIIEQKIDKPY